MHSRLLDYFEAVIRHDSVRKAGEAIHDDLDPAHDHVFEQMSAHVRSQDKPVIESQRPWLVPPFWSRIQMPIGPGDLPLIEYQRWLQELKIATAI